MLTLREKLAEDTLQEARWLEIYSVLHCRVLLWESKLQYVVHPIASYWPVGLPLSMGATWVKSLSGVTGKSAFAMLVIGVKLSEQKKPHHTN